MRTFFLALIALLAGAVGASAQCLSGYSPRAVADALVAKGYRAQVESLEDGQPVIRLGMQGNDVNVYLYDCDSGEPCTGLTLRVGFDLDQGMSYEQINQWNYDNRLSRAFLDKDMDPFLEADMTFTGGVGHENLMTTFADFEDSLGRFKTFVGW